MGHTWLERPKSAPKAILIDSVSIYAFIQSINLKIRK